MKNSKVKNKASSIKSNSLIQLLDNSFIVKKMCPTDEEAYKRTEQNLKRINIRSVERVYSYKIIVMLIVAIISVFIYSQYLLNQKSIIIDGSSLNSGISSSSSINYSGNDTSAHQNEIINEILRKSIYLEPSYNNYISNNQFQHIATIIKKSELALNIDDTDNSLAKGTMQKFLDIEINTSINPMVILVIMIITLLSSKIVNYYCDMKNLIRKSKIEKEIQLLELLTLIFIKNSDISVLKLLLKLTKYSKSLKPYFIRCLNTYSADPIGSIDSLIEEVSTEDFTLFMFLIQQNLISDTNTNIELLTSQKNSSFTMADERYKRKLNRFSKIFTFLSFPLWLIAMALIFLPLLQYINISN
jgi:hypothetical protein